jgi:hypothetical protein
VCVCVIIQQSRARGVDLIRHTAALLALVAVLHAILAAVGTVDDVEALRVLRLRLGRLRLVTLLGVIIGDGLLSLRRDGRCSQPPKVVAVAALVLRILRRVRTLPVLLAAAAREATKHMIEYD